jgi:4-hydroxybenzoate polyprenyltransferase
MYYLVFLPYLNLSKTHTSFHPYTTLLIAITTTVLAGGGYVINDILDVSADAINKPNKSFIPIDISFSNAWKYYYILNGIGLISSFILAYVLVDYQYIFIYLISAIILYFYSKKFKHQVHTGNIIVAIFCAFVPTILAYSFLDEYFALSANYPDQARWIKVILFFYVLFAFQSTLIREMIKDIDDFDGDTLVHSRTLATVYGIERATIFSFFHTVVLLVIIVSFIWYIGFNLDNFPALILGIIFLILPTIYILYTLYRASTSFAKEASKMLKVLMLLGLLYLIIINL